MLGARFCRTVPSRITVVEYAREPRAALILRSGRSPRLEGWGWPHACRRLPPRRCPPSPFETLAIARGRHAWSRSRLAPQDEGGPRSTLVACGLDSPPFIPAHSASSRAFTPVFDGLWTRVNALMLGTHIPETVVMGPRNGVPATHSASQ